MQFIKILLSILCLVPCVAQGMNKASLLQKIYQPALQATKAHPYLATTIAASTILGTTWYLMNGYERRDNWRNISLDISKFPDNFSWGAATSALQFEGVETLIAQENEIISGNVKNNWTAWENEEIFPKDTRPWWQKLLFKRDTTKLTSHPRIDEEHRMGNATGHWNKYPEDYALAKEFGLDSLRISFEWSKAQPDCSEDEINKAVIDHYIERLRVAKDLGLKLAICGYHHALPNWFAQLGGFEKAENIHYFVDYMVSLFKRVQEEDLLDTISFWLTFNEPAGYALGAYVYGKYPPGKFLALKECGTVVKNMLDAHSEIYHAIKELDPTAQISIAHMMQPLQPYNPWNPLDQLPAKLFGHLLNNVTLEYLSTGKFTWLRYINETNERAKDTLDFVGVNYYTHTLLSNFKPKVRPTEITADADEGEAGKAIYAEGFYDALKTVHKYFPNKPIYVTELGFSCKEENHKKREKFIKRHLYVMQKAMVEDNITIIGCDWWTLLDCYGWNSGNGSRYGLYHVDFDHEDKPRSEKQSSLYLKDIIAEYHRTHTNNNAID